MRRALTIAWVALGCCGLAACDSLGPEDVASVNVSPAAATVEVARTVRLTAALQDDQGQPLSGPELLVAWASSDEWIPRFDDPSSPRAPSTASPTKSLSRATATAVDSGQESPPQSHPEEEESSQTEPPALINEVD